MTATRLDTCFAALKEKKRAALVPFMTAGDPDYDTSLSLLKALPEAGADIIELGMPFSDPMADGPAIQASSLRALNAGQTMGKTLQMVREFRKDNQTTPLILMGYYNPVYVYPANKFVQDAKEAGVDGLIVVDVPPEADDELCLPALEAGLSFIRLATPTTDEKRLPAVLQNTSGFVYYVSVAGITGTGRLDVENVETHISAIGKHTDLPIAVGFGIKTPEQAASVAKIARAVVIGSTFVNLVSENLEKHQANSNIITDSVTQRVREFASAIRNVNAEA